MDQKKSKEYWKKRADRQEKKVHKEGDKLLKELDKNLTNARKEIQKSINDLVVRYMDLTELSYADVIKNLTSSEFKEWRMTLEEYMAEIEKFKGIDEDIANKLKLELETLAMKSRISRLDTLKAQIDMELNRKAYAEQEALKGTLETVYNDSYRDIRLDFGVESSVAYLDTDTLSDLINYPWSGTDFSNRIWENRAALGRVLKEEIIQSFIQGISVKDLSDKIMGRMKSDRKNTERLVRTELNYALNQATKKGYEDSEVEEYEYLAEIDSRTSPQCRELNGKIFKLEDAKVGVNYPPMHPHCRSTTIPVIEYEKLKEPEKNGIMEIENKRFNNYEEAKKGLEKKGIIFKDNLSKLDEKLLVDNANKLAELLEKYEFTQNYVNEKQFIFDAKKGDFIGMCSCKIDESSQTIFLNPDYFKSYSEYVEQQLKQIKDNWKMPASKEKISSYTISHEFGHFIQNILFKKIKEKNPEEWLKIKERALTKNTNSAILKILKSWYNTKATSMRKEIINIAKKMDNDISSKTYGKYISDYGKTSPQEFFAECFANLESGNPNILGKAIKIYLEEVF